MKIQAYDKRFAYPIAKLFHAAVHAIDSTIYTVKQKQAWSPEPIDYQRWQKRLEIKQPFVAISDDKVAGFMELEADGHIDGAYTHPEFQRQGVASLLLQHAQLCAQKKGITSLYTEASIVARPFFEKSGFHYIETNQVPLRGEVLINFTMQKLL